LVASRAAAHHALEQGLVEVDGIAEPKPATMVDAAAVVRLAADPARFVSRGGLKLEAALDTFAVEVEGRRAVDVGASTGGFTDCLLQGGAVGVVAVDVGYGQIDWKLRTDARVEVVERTNIRYADPVAVGAPFDLVVADLSFISLATVADQLRELGGPDADWVLLVKPQFEAGRDQVGKGGVIRDPEVQAGAVVAAVAALDASGLGVRGAVASPVKGAKGNREFLVWARREPRTLGDEDLQRMVRDAG
jgi:23S rRNA (cytidine1920-2'-O)/16S rRNA (cytidine1409-2'-O)-methyltransferase